MAHRRDQRAAMSTSTGWPTLDAVEAMYEGQLSAVAAVRPALAAIARAAEDAADGLQAGGRLVYAGRAPPAASRCRTAQSCHRPSTGRSDHLVFAMAGGTRRADPQRRGRGRRRERTPRARCDAANVGANDVVIGLAASGTDPLHRRAASAATEAGAVTIGVANNPRAPLLARPRHPILTKTGAEVMAGIDAHEGGHGAEDRAEPFLHRRHGPLGRVYRGMMVHMQATNAKLHRRAAIMVALITGCPEDEADKALRLCGFDVKVACLIVGGLPPRRGRRAARQAQGQSARRAERTSARSALHAEPRPHHA